MFCREERLVIAGKCRESRKESSYQRSCQVCHQAWKCWEEDNALALFNVLRGGEACDRREVSGVWERELLPAILPSMSSASKVKRSSEVISIALPPVAKALKSTRSRCKRLYHMTL
ncbi:hypothetical protein NL676_013033 [Syzygium grande]|nr:hypothetical protein NL676_013033 [Syzygium grande]